MNLIFLSVAIALCATCAVSKHILGRIRSYDYYFGFSLYPMNVICCVWGGVMCFAALYAKVQHTIIIMHAA